MRKIITCLMAVLSLNTACSTLSSAEKAERDAKRAQAVEKALAERQYTVNVTMVNPRRGSVTHVSSDYSLKVKGDTLVSYLPYFGRAYSLPYGGGKGFNFTAPVKEYRSEKGRKGDTKIDIIVDTEEDIVTYRLDVFPDGNTSIDVTSRNRESISYSGQLDMKN